MPSKGPYTVQLIDAKTKQAFKEHPGRNGMDGYIEVEPGLDYFIRLQNNSSYEILWTKKVDGLKIRHKGYLEPELYDDDGVWSYNSLTRTSTTKALSFHNAIVNPRTLKEEDIDQNNEVGVIKIKIYEAVEEDGYGYMEDIKNDFVGSSKVNATHAQETKKFLKSGIGSVTNNAHDSGKRHYFQKGAKLQTIKIKYCSTVGLIVDGVLPKPPSWEWFRLVKPQAVIPSPQLEIEPFIGTNERKDGNGNVVETTKYEIFDLTALEDMDEDSGCETENSRDILCVN